MGEARVRSLPEGDAAGLELVRVRAITPEGVARIWCVEPGPMEAVRASIARLEYDLQWIHAQLSAARHDKEAWMRGRFTSERELKLWRARTLWARSAKMAELAELRAWVREQLRRQALAGPTSEPDRLLFEAVQAFRQLAWETKSATPEQWQAVEPAKLYLEATYGEWVFKGSGWLESQAAPETGEAAELAATGS
jgi:hypothetical protein